MSTLQLHIAASARVYLCMSIVIFGFLLFPNVFNLSKFLTVVAWTTFLDFQKIAGLIHEFLLKLNEAVECSELRDALNYTLLQLQRYYRTLHAQSQRDADSRTVPTLDVAFSPMTPRSDAPDKFTWKWVELDSSNRISRTLPVQSSKDNPRLPVIIRATRQGDNGFITQLLEHGL